MSDIVKRMTPGLPANFVSKLTSGISESRATTILAGGGKPLMRLLKAGNWVFGQGDDAVEPGSWWIVNVMSVQHGWNCWVPGEGKNAKNTLKGEIMVSMIEPKPIKPEPIDGTEWKEQRSFDLKCYNGEDEGTETLYKTSSYGGMKAVDGLLASIQAHLMEEGGAEYPCPVLELTAKDYKHDAYGQTFNPILTIVAWSDMNGNLYEDQAEPVEELVEEPAPEPVKPVKPISKPLRAAKAPPTAPEAPAPAAPVATAQAHVGQRRRPPVR